MEIAFFLKLPTKNRNAKQVRTVPKEIKKLATIEQSPDSVQCHFHAHYISLTNILLPSSLIFTGLRRLSIKLRDRYLLCVYVVRSSSKVS